MTAAGLLIQPAAAAQGRAEFRGNTMQTSYTETNRIGDHIWYISDVSKFASHYPGWRLNYTLEDILVEIASELTARGQA